MRRLALLLACVACAAAAINLAAPGSARADGGLTGTPVLGSPDPTGAAPLLEPEVMDTATTIGDALSAVTGEADGEIPDGEVLNTLLEPVETVAKPLLAPVADQPLAAARPVLDAVGSLAPPLAPVIHHAETLVDTAEQAVGGVLGTTLPDAGAALPVNAGAPLDALRGAIDAIVEEILSFTPVPITPLVLPVSTPGPGTSLDAPAPPPVAEPETAADAPTRWLPPPEAVQTFAPGSSGSLPGIAVAAGAAPAMAQGGSGGPRLPLPEYPGASACVAALALLGALALIRGGRPSEIGPPPSATCLPAVPPG